MIDLIDVVIDFETYYDADYTLSKLTTVEYVLDPQFEVIGFSISIAGAPARWHTGTYEELKAVLDAVPWGRARVIAHNVMFDGAILEWRFGINPSRYFCTLMAARPYVAPHTGSVSLAAVAKYLGEGEKGREVENHRGRRRAQFTQSQLDSYGAYCRNDTDMTSRCAVHLIGWLPEDEQYLLHLTLLKFLRPSFVLDGEAIEAGTVTVQEERDTVSTSVCVMGHDPDDLGSRAKFAAILKGYGVEPPKKQSKTTGAETYAFAKGDEDFLALLSHDKPAVREIVKAKLLLGSNIEMTRFARFQKIWDLDLGGTHLLPVPLMYYAAHPGRFGGTDSLNLQNLPRPSKKDPRKGALRRCMAAPPGYGVLAVDYSNIEARMVATLAGQWDLVNDFRAGVDVYVKFATKIYGRLIDKDRDPIERFVGKTCILGLGYGMGWQRLQETLGLAGVPVTDGEAKRIVYLYRDTYPMIKRLWDTLGREIEHCMNPKAMFKSSTYAPIIYCHERIMLPNGMHIAYPSMSVGTGSFGREITFLSKRRGSKPVATKLHGGIVTENVSQALARITATSAEIRIARKGLPTAHQAHDELIWVLRKDWIPRLKPAIEKEMIQPVPWLPRLPIAVEGHVGPTYGDCK